MCNLIECIEKYEADNGININYSWKGQDEGDEIAPQTLLSSWTKILAAYNLKKIFYI